MRINKRGEVQLGGTGTVISESGVGMIVFIVILFILIGIAVHYILGKTI